MRSLPHEGGTRVRRLAISPTLADVCAALAHAAGALLRVHTCNGLLVGQLAVPERVTSLCYSTAPEGHCLATTFIYLLFIFVFRPQASSDKSESIAQVFAIVFALFLYIVTLL